MTKNFNLATQKFIKHQAIKENLGKKIQPFTDKKTTTFGTKTKSKPSAENFLFPMHESTI